ncbi:MAG: hypothetical protein HY905_07880 [Deltaproteobacteria bacterium]|nr:hypothetical protein [Deltaproteobacteria bacterium]
MNTDREGHTAGRGPGTLGDGSPAGDTVVVTAAETVNGLGIGWPAVREALAAGRDALGEARDLAAAFRPGTVAAPCPPPDARRYLGTPKLRKLMSDDAFLATVAGKLAVAAAGLSRGPDRPIADDRFAAFVACGIGAAGWRELVPVFRDSMDDDGRLSLARLGERGLRRCNPLFAFQVLANMPLCFLSIEESLRGDNLTFAPWEGGGADAIAEAAASLRRGDADAAVVCGASAMAGTQGVYWLAEKGLLTPPQVRPRPLGIPASPAAGGAAGFHAPCLSGIGVHRCPSVVSFPDPPGDSPVAGLAPADGAAALVLERFDNARRRGARPLAALAAFARETLATDGFAPCRDSSVVARVARRALERAAERHGTDSAPASVGAVILSASGDPEGDRAEASGVAQALGGPFRAVVPASAWGNLFAAGPATAVAIAAHALAGDGPTDDGALAGAVLVVCAGPGGAVAAIVLEKVSS